MHILFVLELIGTVAFAGSGAIVGIQKKMDLFGVCILGLTTAVGGGILRDLILNVTPPAAFQNPAFALTAVLVSLALFLPSVRSSYGRREALYKELILLMDSLGLGLFTVVGVQSGMAAMAERNLFLATFVGVLTGVGGGVMRDVMAGNMPNIFVRHFYACAAILGAWCCALLWGVIGELPSMIAGAALTLVLRLLAAHYRWSLPKAK
jgi:uncharacterized membrane protein YeiH